MFLDSGRLGEAAHFFSTMGFFNFIFISGVPLVLYLTHAEHCGSPSSLPWGYLCGIAALWLGECILTHSYTDTKSISPENVISLNWYFPPSNCIIISLRTHHTNKTRECESSLSKNRKHEAKRKRDRKRQKKRIHIGMAFPRWKSLMMDKVFSKWCKGLARTWQWG